MVIRLLALLFIAMITGCSSDYENDIQVFNDFGEPIIMLFRGERYEIGSGQQIELTGIPVGNHKISTLYEVPTVLDTVKDADGAIESIDLVLLEFDGTPDDLSKSVQFDRGDVNCVVNYAGVIDYTEKKFTIHVTVSTETSNIME